MAKSAKDNSPFAILKRKIEDRSVAVGVLGAGRVGLPLAVAACEAGFKIIAVDPNAKLVAAINAGKGAGFEEDSRTRAVVKKGLLKASVDPKALSKCQIAVICVPTPLRKRRELDLDYIEAASDSIGEHIEFPCLIILESTTYPGTTEEVVLPRIVKKGRAVGKDIFLAHAPERLDPGNPLYGITNTTKLVGGVTDECSKLAGMFYSAFVSRVRIMKSAKEAEMAKLFENIFRNVNIALVNEFVQICSRMGIDAHDVLEGAATKEFGFMSFKPGPGVGGHCIPLDPYYLLWKSREFDVHPRFISLALEINENMPYYVVDKLAQALNERGKCLKGSKVMILGVTYKSGTADLRESPALKVFEILRSKGAKVSYSDPYCPTLTVNGVKTKNTPATDKNISSVDAVVITTAHPDFDYKAVLKNAALVLDTRRVLKGAATRGKVEWL